MTVNESSTSSSSVVSLGSSSSHDDGMNRQIRIDSNGAVIVCHDNDHHGSLDAAPFTRLPTAIIGMGERAKKWRDMSRIEKAFLWVSLLNAVFLLAITVYRLINLTKKEIQQGKQPDFVFAIVILINIVGMAYLNAHAVFMEKVFELCAGIAAVLGVLSLVTVELFYGIRNANSTSNSSIDFSETPSNSLMISKNIFNLRSPELDEKWARALGEWPLAVVSIVLAVMIIRAPKYFIGSVVGANLDLQVAYRRVSIFMSLTKFDTLVAMCFIFLQYNDPNESVRIYDRLTIAIGVPYTFLWLTIGWIAVRAERKDLCCLFVLASFPPMCYAIYKMYREIMFLSEGHETGGWHYVAYAVIFAGCLLLIVRCAILLVLFLVYRKFGIGLKEKVPIFTNPSRYNLIAKCFASYTYYVDSPPLVPDQPNFDNDHSSNW